MSLCVSVSVFVVLCESSMYLHIVLHLLVCVCNLFVINIVGHGGLVVGSLPCVWKVAGLNPTLVLT